MKVVSKGEPLSNAEALAAVRKRLEEYRKQTAPPPSNEESGDVTMDDGTADDLPPLTALAGIGQEEPISAEMDEWYKRVKKLQRFHLDDASCSEVDADRTRFLEALERYLAPIS
ncbi:hypothetical protein BBBOND_0309070 [Babesia bigemina]|uniref:Uncharacterized protein n=1 Tax=Babesia bigemina TaxID=5866 RepID=A0A061DD03_BABBI|nr:hypothetical protein BBBOND_0309070 [Babesia bigemina]CDR97004.1 hypothetical protein BBBOND_0309070 [Babesia bigemina]|eukprot:XP_012769190.1 hypothetical protein BBBOND_0309070 [Babesia bigemina]